MGILDTLDSFQIQEQFVDLASDLLARPSVIILFIWIMLVVFIVLLFSLKDDKKAKVIWIWFIIFVGSSIGLLFVIFMPNTIIKLAEWFQGLM